MNLRDLQYVVAIAEHRHFGRAAAACHVSQPTLSGQVARLENELGIVIFERAGRNVRLTEAGEEIIRHARTALAAAQDILDSARAHRDPLSGRLRLGVIPTLGPYLTPFILSLARERLPRAPLVLVEDLTNNLVPLVREGKLDAALIASEPAATDLLSCAIFEETFFVVAPANHPYVAHPFLRPQDIDPGSLLLLTDGHCLRDQALELCAQAPGEDHQMADMRATSLETLIHLTSAGYGVTLAPQLAIESGRASTERLAVRPLKGDKTSRKVRIIARRHSPRAQAVRELAQIIKSALPAGVRRLGD